MNKYATSWRKSTSNTSALLRVRPFFRDAVLTILSQANKSLEDKFLRCLYCHNVFDDQTQQFDRLLLELKAIGTFVDTDTCVQMLRGDKIIDGRYFHLSFDDGFRNNFQNALPVLKKHKIPSIFFVPSSLIGADWYKTKLYCLETTRYGAVIEMLKWEDLSEMVL